MREIKFRAWDKKEKKMYYNNVCIEDDIAFVKLDNFPDGETISDNLETMQYTGLKDKNGKEIYEGDIGKHKYYPADVEMGMATEIEEVSFAKGAFGLKRGEDNLTFREVMNTDEDFEVIGNIYENKELLK